GYLSGRLVSSGVRFFFSAAARRQLEAEIRAQFERFAATGLELDHVNSHNHMHLHPTVLGTILRVGREFGLRAMRVPWAPPLLSWRLTGRGLAPKMAAAAGLAPWMAALRARLRRRDIRSNDLVLGLGTTGAMDEATVLRLLEMLPVGGVAGGAFPPRRRRAPGRGRATPDSRPPERRAAAR